MLTIIYISLSITSLLFIWFNTSFLLDYSRLLGLDSLLGIDKYKEAQANQTGKEERKPFRNYLHWLNHRFKGNFLVKLVTCVYCLGFWLSLSSCYYFNILPFFLVVYFTSMFAYKWITR